MTKEGDESRAAYLNHLGGYFTFVALAGLSIIGWGLNHHCWAKKSCCFKEYHNPVNIRVFWWMSFIGLCGIFACCISGFVTSYNFANKLGSTKCAYERIYYDSIYGELQSNSTKWEGLSSSNKLTENFKQFLVDNRPYQKLTLGLDWKLGKDHEINPKVLDDDVYYRTDFANALQEKILDVCKSSYEDLRNLKDKLVCDHSLNNHDSIVWKYINDTTRTAKYFSDEYKKINEFVTNRQNEGYKSLYQSQMDLTNDLLKNISEDLNNYKTDFLDKAYHYINIANALGYILVTVFYSILLAIVVFSCFFLWAYSYFKVQRILYILMHICWNILKFFALVFFIFGGAFGALFLLSRDLIGYNKFLFSEANLAENATTYLLPDGETKEFLRYCINEDNDNYINNIDIYSINVIKHLYFNRTAGNNTLKNHRNDDLKEDEHCISTSDLNLRNLQGEIGDSADSVIFTLEFSDVDRIFWVMINDFYKFLNGDARLRNLQGQSKTKIVTDIDNLGETIEKFKCSYLKKEIEILYDSLYELSIESRISCALCSCIAFFAEFSVLFYLLVLYHYNNNLFKDENETQSSFHKTKNRKFDLESQNEFMDKSRPANMKQNNKKLDIEFNFN